MPDKSRRSRRNIASKNKTGPVSKENGTSLVDSSPRTAPAAQGRPASLSSPKLPDTFASTAYLWSEIKWIGLVTLLILVLMVISYFIFR
jgi:hypothetical protein